MQDIVHKFLTREQTYSQLLIAIGEAEQRIDEAKGRNEELVDKLHSLKINTENEPLRSGDLEMYYRRQEAAEKDYGQMKEKQQKAEIVYDQVSGWAEKIYRKLEKVDDAHTKKVPFLFAKIAERVEQEMGPLLKEVRGN